MAASLPSPAFTQSATSYGDVRPYHYESGGGRKSGSWTAEQQGSRNAGQAQASGTQNVQRARGAYARGQRSR
jgi:hypothetical protein